MENPLQAAIEEAKKGMAEGGVPIGSIMVINGRIVSRGHNRQKQMNSIIRHAEMDCIDNAHGLSSDDFSKSILFTTLSPCEMCAGAIIFFRIPRVVIGENQNYSGAEKYLQSRGIKVEVLNDETCIQMLRDFDKKYPGVWNKG